MVDEETVVSSGAAIKYPNKVPVKNSSDTKNTAPREFFCSRGYKPGLINRQISQKVYGKAITNPIIAETVMWVVNWLLISRLCSVKLILSMQSSGRPM